MNSLKKIYIFLCAIAFVACVIFYFISIYFGNNPLNNKATERQLISFFPEGWAFFTKNSAEARLYIYRINVNSVSEINVRNFSSEYYFGMSRDNRIINLQFCTIFKRINNDSSIHYELKAVNIEKLTNSISLDTLSFNNVSINEKVVPNVRGKYLLVVQKMLPWPLIHRAKEYPSNFIIYPIDVTYE